MERINKCVASRTQRTGLRLRLGFNKSTRAPIWSENAIFCPLLVQAKFPAVDCGSLTPTRGATQQSVDCESLTPTRGATQQSVDCESLTPTQGATQQSVGVKTKKRKERGRQNCILGDPQQRGAKSEVFPNIGEQNQKWLPHPYLLGGPKEGGSAMSPLRSRGPLQKGRETKVARAGLLEKNPIVGVLNGGSNKKKYWS